MIKALLIIDIQNDYFENGRMEFSGITVPHQVFAKP